MLSPPKRPLGGQSWEPSSLSSASVGSSLRPPPRLAPPPRPPGEANWRSQLQSLGAARLVRGKPGKQQQKAQKAKSVNLSACSTCCPVSFGGRAALRNVRSPRDFPAFPMGGLGEDLSLIHISEPTRLALI
eukprot:1422871-Alexandrium_andersonii.AAC.1